MSRGVKRLEAYLHFRGNLQGVLSSPPSSESNGEAVVRRALQRKRQEVVEAKRWRLKRLRYK